MVRQYDINDIIIPTAVTLYTKQIGYGASKFAGISGQFPMLCTYLMDPSVIGYPPEEVCYVFIGPSMRGMAIITVNVNVCFCQYIGGRLATIAPYVPCPADPARGIIVQREQ